MKNTREKILEAARIAFSEKGFDGVSMEEIAQRAGVRKALIYYYFPSKEVLFEEVWNSALEELENHIFKEIEGENYYIRKIKRFLRAYIDFVTSKKVISKVIQKEKASILDADQSDSLKSRLKERYNSFVEKVVKLIEEGKQNQVIHPDVDPKAAAQIIAEVVNNFNATPETVSSLQTIILRGLTKEA
ncbi:TetR/AcrR family transcriptional regulator [Pseudothermotoga thermarum]|uniref:Transcriptional regulator, TetR family n=1 Tax=Pseudothermotoga thermarum DSM 5069 TaxID=688269 RepID=F7YWV2_9THEM|nr:TetR/AcrR family transcriptional regulator [Pseudothermotoga thermarum]AEH50472.1 transcriptional regulator, TetR family [Pseudothermotoga thermarum DSM 5069]